MTDEISKAMDRLEIVPAGEVEGTYADYQAATFKNCKNLAKFAQDMVLKSSSSPGELSNSSRELTDTYSQLVDAARGALATIESPEVAARLKKTGYDLGEACKDLIHAGASVQGNREDMRSKRELADCAKVVSEKVRGEGGREWEGRRERGGREGESGRGGGSERGRRERVRGEGGRE